MNVESEFRAMALARIVPLSMQSEHTLVFAQKRATVCELYIRWIVSPECLGTTDEP